MCLQVVDAAISESMFNMLEGCIPEYAYSGHDRPPSGSTISGTQPPKSFTSPALPDGLQWTIVDIGTQLLYYF